MARAVLDLDYIEDKDASVDFERGDDRERRLREVQGSGEEAVFSGAEMTAMLDLAKKGAEELTALAPQGDPRGGPPEWGFAGGTGCSLFTVISRVFPSAGALVWPSRWNRRIKARGGWPLSNGW